MIFANFLYLFSINLIFFKLDNNIAASYSENLPLKPLAIMCLLLFLSIIPKFNIDFNSPLNLLLHIISPDSLAGKIFVG